ncbi:MAG TPA: hypothetical protein VM204_08635 [Gaiellaceae bacterium]|nr:hypothetical protein [Gaiellaceae bacterium]
MRPRAPVTAATCALVALVGAGGEAKAQEPRGAPSVSEQMLAQSLFDEGRQLMDRGRYAEACPKLAESQRLDPGGGTLLNLALCHEKEGRSGTAYLEMKSAAAQAAKDARKDREKIANEHIGYLTSRVPRLAVHVAREEASLEVKVDGTILRKPAWDLLTVIDPGAHVIEAAAPGRAPFRQSVTLVEGEQRTVEVPPLEAADPASAAAAPSPSGARTPAPGEKRTNPWFVGSLAVGVTGFVVGVPAAYVWGMTALFDRTCTPVTDSFYCVSDGVRNTWLAVAAVGLTAGVAGTVGLLAFPSKITVAPSATANGAGALVEGRF